jgi:hypothetical protein
MISDNEDSSELVARGVWLQERMISGRLEMYSSDSEIRQSMNSVLNDTIINSFSRMLVKHYRKLHKRPLITQCTLGTLKNLDGVFMYKS